MSKSQTQSKIKFCPPPPFFFTSSLCHYNKVAIAATKLKNKCQLVVQIISYDVDNIFVHSENPLAGFCFCNT